MNKIGFPLIILLALTFFIPCLLHSQGIKGRNILDFGVGLGTTGFQGTGGTPVSFNYEHGFTDKISAGVGVSYFGKYLPGVKYTYIVFGARGSYHMNEALKISNPKWDVYGGASIFYRSYSLKYEALNNYGKSSDGSLGAGIHAGARYYFTPEVGAFAELGYGVAVLQFGVAFKF